MTAALVVQIFTVDAQAPALDPLNPIPGGATGTNVFCVQAGDLNSGAFTGTFYKTSGDTWEEKPFLKQWIARWKEVKRDETVVDIFDASRNLTIEFDFSRKKVRLSKLNPPDDWHDHAAMLSATDELGSADCVALGMRSGAAAPSGGTPMQLVTIRVGSLNVVPPGTKFGATSGPECPGQPGFFQCPNKFTCAPVGGVCCPGAGSCGAGSFCDRFAAGNCIATGDPRICPGTENPVTGIALHCGPASVCLPGNFCNP